MSFTTDIFASIAEDLRTKPVFDSKSTAMRLITYSNSLQTGFAISKASGLRSIYLSVGNEATTASFPKWHGVSIELAKLPDYGNDGLYLVMQELPNGVDYIFEIIAEDLRKSVEQIADPAQALSTVSEVLAKWKSFFQYDVEILLSDIRQQGLMGELLFLEDAIQEIGAHSVAKWSGSNDETHDFYFDDHAVEIKTTSKKDPYFAHISSEYQMDANDVQGRLFLKFYALRKSQSGGITLPQKVDYIRQFLKGSPALLSQFNEKLQKYGYFDEAATLYTTGYFIRDVQQFEVHDGFPCITPAMIRTGVTGVEYSLSIDQCQGYIVTKEKMMCILKGGKTDVERQNP